MNEFSINNYTYQMPEFFKMGMRFPFPLRFAVLYSLQVQWCELFENKAVLPLAFVAMDCGHRGSLVRVKHSSSSPSFYALVSYIGLVCFPAISFLVVSHGWSLSYCSWMSMQEWRRWSLFHRGYPFPIKSKHYLHFYMVVCFGIDLIAQVMSHS